MSKDIINKDDVSKEKEEGGKKKSLLWVEKVVVETVQPEP